MFKEKKLETQITTREMIKWKTRRQQQTRRQCKPNNARNEHDSNGLLQQNVYKNKRNQKPKQ
jgi:hypothetical protein